MINSIRTVATIIALIATLFVLPLSAQNRPGAFSTLFTSSTDATSVCSGASNVNPAGTPTCTGGVKGGIIDFSTQLTGTTTSDTPVSVTASGNAAKTFNFTSSGTGTGSLAQVTVTNNTGVITYMRTMGGSFTSGGVTQANGAHIGNNGAGGLSILAEHASGVIRFAAGGTTEQWRVEADGDLVPFAANVHDIGSSSVPTGPVYSSQMIFPDITGVNPVVAGARLHLGRATYGFVNCGGYMNMDDNTGDPYALWVDNTGVLRIEQELEGPCSIDDSDTDGTVVGTQSSSLFAKTDVRLWDGENALGTVLSTPTFSFKYRGGAFANDRLLGIVTEESPEFAMDNGKSFNPSSAFAYTVEAIKQLHAEIESLRAEVARLRNQK